MSEKSATEKLFDEYPDEVRLPMIVESDDWDERITPALVEVGTLLDSKALNMLGFLRILRVIIEAVYIMGYERGLLEGETKE